MSGSTENQGITESRPSYDEWRTHLGRELGALAVNQKRPISGAFAAAFLSVMRTKDGLLQQALSHIHRYRTDLPPPAVQRLLLTAWQNEMMDIAGYPGVVAAAPPDEAERICRESFEGKGPLAMSQDQRYNFAGNVVWRRLNTPVPQRGVFRRFVNVIMQHRLGCQPLGYDVGCSDNSMNRQAALADTFPLESVSIESTIDGKPDPIRSRHASFIFNSGIIADMAPAGRWVGLDLINPNEQINKHWIRACPQPEEIWHGRLSVHDALMQAEADTAVVDFALCDFARQDQVEQVLDKYGPADQVNFSFSWSQGDASEQQAKFDHALLCLKPGGIITFFEPVRINRNLPPPHFELLDEWDTIGGFVWDTADNTIYNPMVFSDGRCTRGQVLPDSYTLAGQDYKRLVSEMLPI